MRWKITTERTTKINRAALAFQQVAHSQFLHMATPGCILVSEELLTEWSLSCVHINHLGTLLQKELRRDGEHANAIDLAERVGQRAWALHEELRQHGARNSNAKIQTPQCIQLREELTTRWAENCADIYSLGSILDRELPRNRTYARAIDLAGRAKRRAWTIYSELVQNGANAPATISR
jgi:hypothetical protein